ncbi:MAG TPA: hypothetical protein VF245_06765 [Solirubrobacterales bacterium]
MPRGIKNWVRQIALVVVIAALYTAIGPAHAVAAVYWGSSRDGVGAANLDGGNPLWDYFYWPFPSESSGPACGVAVDSEYLYWAAWDGIGRRKLDGEGIYPATIVPHLHEPCGLAVGGDHIYWGTPGGNPPPGQGAGSIGRANLDGSEANALITGLELPCDVAEGGDHVFWVEHDFSQPKKTGIGRANLNGTAPERPFIPIQNPSCGLTASGGYLYWGQDEGIARANFEGDELDEAFIPNAGLVEGIDVQGGHIYWAASWRDRTSSIGRANLDGSEANPVWIPSDEGKLGGVALDERPTPPNLILPSRSIEIAQNAEYNLHSGAALLGVYVPPHGSPATPSPPQGQLTVVSRGLNWKIFSSSVPHETRAGAYLWQVRVRAGKGAVGRRVRAELRRRGWARVTVRLSYTQDRVYPVEASRTLILRRYHGASTAWVKHPSRPPKTS